MRYVRIAKWLPEPRYQTDGAAGLDLHCAHVGPITLGPGDSRCIDTGLAVEIPAGYEGQVRPRSGLAFREGVASVLGTIDSDYRGEVKVLLFNFGKNTVTVHPGDRVAQLVVSPVSRVTLHEVSALSESERGSGGFGSTGR